MNPDHPDEIFNDALEMTPEERAAFVSSRCDGDEALRKEVESLLRVAGDFPRMLEFPDPVKVPDRIGRFRVIEALGAGGMGAVYKAEDPEIGHVVALKVLSTSRSPLLQRTRWLEGARVRLQQEARCLAQLRHPNIATLHALEYDQDTPYLVMELVEGRTLSELVATESLTPAERLRICRGIAAGIEAAHEKGIIHLDLKPGNVIVTPGGEPKVLDFGIARAVEASERSDDAPGDFPLGAAILTSRAGTPGYMSPEQARGDPVDARADVWSFAQLACDVLGAATSDGSQCPPPTGGIRCGLARAPRRRLQRLLARCLEEERSARPESMSEVRQEVDAAIAQMRRGEASRRALRVLFPALAGIAGALGFAGVRWATREAPVPVECRLLDRNVEVRYSRGKPRLFSLPDTIASKPDGAWILGTSDGEAARAIVARTGTLGEGRPSHLTCWDWRGRVFDCVPTTRDWPWSDASSDALEASTKKRFTFVFPPDELHRTFVALEYSHNHPCVLRAFDIQRPAVTEVFRLYHPGQINDKVRFTPAVGRPGAWMWITGVLGDPDLRRAARGVHRNTHFLACFEADAAGAQVFPPWSAPDPGFLRNHSGAVFPADPVLYFVVRGCSAEDGRIDWERTNPLWIDDPIGDGRPDLGLLCNTTVRFDFHAVDSSAIRLDLSASGDLAAVLGKRAAASGVDRAELIASFLEDSVVSLAYVRAGLTLSGGARDISASLPGPWDGSARPGAARRADRAPSD